jgi:predicted metalloprotease
MRKDLVGQVAADKEVGDLQGRAMVMVMVMVIVIVMMRMLVMVMMMLVLMLVKPQRTCGRKHTCARWMADSRQQTKQRAYLF